MSDLTVYQIPVCPFTQRLAILLDLKGLEGRLKFHVVDITKPRPDWLLAKSRGTTALPILETEEGQIIKESMVILRYLEDRFPDPPVQQRDPYRRAVEGMMTATEGAFGTAGYSFVMNQDRSRRHDFEGRMLRQFARLNAFLEEHSPHGVWLFEAFGFAEAVFTPLLMRFWFLDYYEDFHLPEDPSFNRVRRWRDACLGHPAAQQVTREEIVKVYYDYAKGAGNGALVEGRIAGLSAVLDLEQTMERTIYLRGMVDVRGIALMRWALRDVAQPVIFDVGANVGNHSAALRDIAGHIYAFEPNPALLARLDEMIVRNGVDNITAVGLALSDRPGVGRLSVPAGHSERAALKDAEGAEGAVDVEVTAGDAFVAERGVTRLDLVKIDVEGHEPAVLAGLAATLERLRPTVVFERYATGPAYSRDAFARLLAGYRLFGTQKRKLMVGRRV
jgi:glutathione S-transferase